MKSLLLFAALIWSLAERVHRVPSARAWTHVARWLATAALSAAVAACGGGGSSPGETPPSTPQLSATATIPITGGTVSLPGRAWVEVGAGVFREDVQVTLSATPASEPDVLLANDVVLEMPVDALDTTSQAEITIYVYPDDSPNAGAGRARALGLQGGLDPGTVIARMRVGAKNAVVRVIDVTWDAGKGAYRMSVKTLDVLSAALIWTGQEINEATLPVRPDTLLWNIVYRAISDDTNSPRVMYRWAEPGRLEPVVGRVEEHRDSRIPLILVHGISIPTNVCGSNPSYEATWNEFAKHFFVDDALKAQDDLYTFQYPTNRMISDNARFLARRISEHFDNRPVVVVAHSMGGLVTRSTQVHYSRASPVPRVGAPFDIKVHRVITLNSPHRGVPWIDNLAQHRQMVSCPFETHQGAIDLAWEFNDDGACANPLLCASDGLNKNLEHLKDYVIYAGQFEIDDPALLALLGSITPQRFGAVLDAARLAYLGDPRKLFFYPRLVQFLSQSKLPPAARSRGDGFVLIKSQRLQDLNGVSWADVPSRFRRMRDTFSNTDHVSIHDDPAIFNGSLKPDLLEFAAEVPWRVEPPEFITPPQPTSVLVGQTATFSVSVARASGVTFEWRRGNLGSSLPAAGENRGQSYTTPPTALTDDGGTYFVIARNPAGVATASSVATLTVTAATIAPTITTQPRAVTVNVGQLAAFSVTAAGTSPSYEWRRGNATSSVVAPRATNSATYTTPATTLVDNGSSYFVIVSNSAGSTISNVVSLTVLPATSGNTQVVMTATPDPVRPGQLVQYAVTVTNRGTSSATYTTEAQVPNHTTVPAGSIGQGGSCVGLLSTVPCPAGRTVRWSDVILAGQSITLQFAALVDTASPPPNGTVIRSTATAQGGSSGASAGVDVVVSTADLSLGMVNTPSPVVPGGALSYTLRFGNPGEASSSAAVLTATLPPGTSFATASDGGTVAGGVVQWDVGVLAPGAAGQRQLVVLVDALASNGSVVNATADLRDAATGRSLARANAAAAVLTSSNTQAVITATPDPVRPGQLVQYAVTVTNRGTSSATYTTEAQVPNHTTVPAGSIGQGGSCVGLLITVPCPAGGTIRWSDVILAGQSITLQFAALVDTASPPPNGTVIRSTATAQGGSSGASAWPVPGWMWRSGREVLLEVDSKVPHRRRICTAHFEINDSSFRR